MRRILARYIFVRSKDTKIRDFFRQIICVACLKSLCSERLCADSVAKYVQLESTKRSWKVWTKFTKFLITKNRVINFPTLIDTFQYKLWISDIKFFKFSFCNCTFHLTMLARNDVSPDC